MFASASSDWGSQGLRDTGQAMSQENLEIVRRCVETLNSRDVPRALELFDPEIEIDLSRNVFNPSVYRGHSGVEQWMNGVEDVWDDFSGVPEELIDADDRVLAALTLQGKGKGSGVPVQVLLFSIWTVRDSKIVRLVGGYRGRSEALEAMALPDTAR